MQEEIDKIAIIEQDQDMEEVLKHFNQLNSKLKEKIVQLSKITVWETQTSCCSYFIKENRLIDSSGVQIDGQFEANKNRPESSRQAMI